MGILVSIVKFVTFIALISLVLIIALDLGFSSDGFRGYEQSLDISIDFQIKSQFELMIPVIYYEGSISEIMTNLTLNSIEPVNGTIEYSFVSINNNNYMRFMGNIQTARYYTKLSISDPKSIDVSHLFQDRVYFQTNEGNMTLDFRYSAGEILHDTGGCQNVFRPYHNHILINGWDNYPREETYGICA